MTAATDTITAATKRPRAPRATAAGRRGRATHPGTFTARPTARWWLITVASVVISIIAIQTHLATAMAAGLLGAAIAAYGWISAAVMRTRLTGAGLTLTATTSPAPLVRTVPATLTMRIPVPLRAALGRWGMARITVATTPLSPELFGRFGAQLQFAQRADGWFATAPLALEHRGRFDLAPATVVSIDPIGLVKVSGTVDSQGTCTVLPYTAAITPPASTGHRPSSGQVSAGAGRVPAMDDALLREYVPGDDLRRVHWARSTRHRTLLVRAEERSPAVVTTVVVDERLFVPREGDDWVVELVASLGAALAGSQHILRFAPLRGGGAGEARTVTATELSELLVDPPAAMVDDHEIAQALLTAPHESVIAILAPLPPELASQVVTSSAGRRPGSQRRAAVIARPAAPGTSAGPAMAGTGPTPTGRASGQAPLTAPADDATATAAALTEAGWTALPLTWGGSFSQVEALW